MAAAAAPPARAPAAAGSLDERFDLSLPNASREEMNALTEDVELDDRTRRLVLALARLVTKSDPHALLGVGGDADVKAVKRGYRAMSKEIHPDRYYSKRIGTFKDRLAFVFEAVTRAHNRLTAVDPKKQAGRTADEPQTPAEHAAEVFELACAAEVAGDYTKASKLFAAAIRTDPQTRFLRRAASCALAANQPKTAVEYAKKAQTQDPYDPSSARLLARAFRAAGKLADAEEVLIMAMAMKSENDVLTSELRYDLAEVRRLLAE
jgi:tetratricopeptide (TPR) repeat protein